MRKDMTIEEMLQTMDYKRVLYYFTELSKIPRGSGNNQGISDFLVQFAKDQNLKYIQDDALNVVIYKEASKGYEAHTPVILQGHMDMVCVKEPDCIHDFKTEGLELFTDGEFLRARKTTLGGDDGVALAYGMALLADDTLKHPALEIVITTDEETGMDGAIALDPSCLKGRMMINVDSEEEDIVLVSSAGGSRVLASIDLQQKPQTGYMGTIVLSGLKGGHSGAEINSNRTNAVLAMARLLFELKQEEFSLIELSGGEKENAIPSISKAEIVVSSKEDAEKLKQLIEVLKKTYQKELQAAEPQLKIEFNFSLEQEQKEYLVLHPTSFEKVLFLLIQAPNGVQTMSAEIEGLVETSLNLGIFEIDETKAKFHYSIRSSIGSAKGFLAMKLLYLFELFGGSCEIGAQYPAWEYRKDSPLREKFSQVYMQIYKKAPKFSAIHAGLECGLIAEKIPQMDIVSIGPNLYDIHSPKERLEIQSFLRVYQFLEKLLEAMK